MQPPEHIRGETGIKEQERDIANVNVCNPSRLSGVPVAEMNR
jgi:hypothetical protein